MKNVKKVLALGLSIAMVFGVAACGNDTPANNAGSESTPASESTVNKESSEVVEEKDPVTLEWWYRGNGAQQDTEVVEAAFNELLKTYPGMEHVTVNLNCYTSAEYAQAVTLAQSAGQQIDILNTVSLDFNAHVESGSYMALDDLLTEELKETLPDWLWEMGTVDGSIYMIPHYQRAANMNYIMIPKEYMDKYGDLDKFKEVFNDGEWTVEEAAALLEEFTLAVQAGEGKTHYAMPFGRHLTNKNELLGYNDVITGKYYLKFADSDTVEHMYMTEDAVKSFEIAGDWFERGLIHPDVMTTNLGDFTGANMLNDVSCVYTFQNSAGPEDVVSEQISATYGFETYAIALYPYYFIPASWGAGGDGISASCENPEEAMRLLELMNTEEGVEAYNMIVYGLEGTHYEKIDDTHIKTLEYDSTQGSAANTYAAHKWIMGNTFNAYLNQGCAEGENEIAKDINENPDNVKSELIGFAVKVDDISSEIAQATAVVTEYSAILYTGGAGKEWKTYYDEFVTKMENAGHKEIVAELQAQVDAHLAK